MTNWNLILEAGTVSKDLLEDFVNGYISGETLQRCFRTVYPEASAELRNVIRNRGVAETRRLAQKALRSRNLI